MYIILGKAKTGKSKYIYDLINKDIQNQKKSILFVPSRQIAQDDYMKQCRTKRYNWF